MSRKSQRSRVVNILMWAVCCVLLLSNLSWAEISADELEKIQKAAPEKASAEPKKPRKLLVFNLCNDFKHSSIPYVAKALEVTGKKTGAFEVVQSTDMAMFKAENLKQFDAVCLNNTTKLDFSDEKLKVSLLNFVKGGKGIVGIHAASDNFYDWTAGAELIGGLFDGHPWRSGGTWAFKIDDVEHPLTAAFKGKGFKLKDEIYRLKAPYSRERLRVLVSLDMSDDATRNVKDAKPADKDIPISWIQSYGNGREFYCSFGHNHDILWNPVILKHYLDGIQFAMGDLEADATPSLENALKKIHSYEYGQSRKPLTEIADFVRYGCNDPDRSLRTEKRFLAFLQSGATPAARQFICRQLSIIGTAESVPNLTAMLTEKATSSIEPSDMARYALERIPSVAVDQALRQVLSRTSGKVKIGIINTLGHRRDSGSVGMLSKLVYAEDGQVATAAATALGQIGDLGAAEVLEEARGKTEGKLQLLVMDASLNCADKLLADNNKAAAIKIYKQLYKEGAPSLIRVGALGGLVAGGERNIDRIVLKAIRSDDAKLQAAAIGLTRQLPSDRMTKALTKALPKLSSPAQVQLLSALADRGDAKALRTVAKAAKAEDESVRIAALRALGKLGDSSTVGLLAKTAATSAGDEQKAARQSLYTLSAPLIDATIIANIEKADNEVKVELIKSMDERRITSATELLLKTAQGSDKKVRIESFRALAAVADARYLPTLIDLLTKVQTDADRAEAENAVVAVANKIDDENRRADAVLQIPVVEFKSATLVSLLNVLGKIRGPDALKALRNVLGESHSDAAVQAAAVRALADWPTNEPLQDLLKVAGTSSNERNRALALRGYIRLIGLQSDRPAEETLGMYRRAMQLSANAGEKKLVLSGLPKVKTLGSLQMAAQHLSDAQLQTEAEAAAVEIARQTKNSNPKETRPILEKIISGTKNDGIRNRAKDVLNRMKKPLWNGKDWTGWKRFIPDENVDVNKVWSIKNGVIRCEGLPKGYIRTEADYSNYKLYLQWRWAAEPTNSGVLLHARGPDKVWPKCIESQLKTQKAGDFVLIGGTGITVDGKRWQDVSKEYVKVPKKEASSEKPAGQWNSYEIVCRGNTITIYVNGVLQNEGKEASQTSGKICLQSEGSPIEFRNIYIEFFD